MNYREGLRFVRLIMVVSSFSPLFVLWAIRGISLIRDLYFVPACMFLVLAPVGLLWLRMRTAKAEDDQQFLKAGVSEDQRSHLLSYLFASLLPLYQDEIASFRHLAAVIFALFVIIFIFWKLNLHYINLLFLIRGGVRSAVGPVESAAQLLTSQTGFLDFHRPDVDLRRRVVLDRMKARRGIIVRVHLDADAPVRPLGQTSRFNHLRPGFWPSPCGATPASSTGGAATVGTGWEG